MLIFPFDAKTQTAVSGPLGPGPSSTMTRFASTAPASRLSVDTLGVPQVPFESGGYTLTNVEAVPATPVRLRTAAAAVLAPGIWPPVVTVTSIGLPATRMPCVLHGLDAGVVLRVSHTRTGLPTGWNSPAGVAEAGGSK